MPVIQVRVVLIVVAVLTVSWTLLCFYLYFGQRGCIRQLVQVPGTISHREWMRQPSGSVQQSVGRDNKDAQSRSRRSIAAIPMTASLTKARK